MNGRYGRRLLEGEHRGHLELCGLTIGGTCDLGCLDPDELLRALELAQAAPGFLQSVRTWARLVAIIGAAVAFWTLLVLLLLQAITS